MEFLVWFARRRGIEGAWISGILNQKEYTFHAFTDVEIAQFIGI